MGALWYIESLYSDGVQFDLDAYWFPISLLYGMVSSVMYMEIQG